MSLIRLTAPQRETLRQALLDRYQNAASLEEMLVNLDQRFAQISVEGQNFRQNLGTVIRTAEAEGWLLALVKQVREDVPGDPRLQGLYGELAPLSLLEHVDPFDVCRLAASRVMVDREPLRTSLRLLSAPLGRRIMVVTGRKSSGKSHSVQLISYLNAVRGGFFPIIIDLEAYGRVLGTDTIIEPDDIARALVKKLRYDLGPTDPPKDAQWARWVLDFCDDFEAYALEDDRCRWVVIDGFGSIVLAQATLDLIKELAVRINRSLLQFRLILLGYDDASLPPFVFSQVERERIGPIGIPQLTQFFHYAYRQLKIPSNEEMLVASCNRVLDGLDPDQEDFLFHLEPRVSEELDRAAGQEGS